MNLSKKLRYFVCLASLLVCVLVSNVSVFASSVDDSGYYNSGVMPIFAGSGETYAGGRITYADAESLVSQYSNIFKILSTWTKQERAAYAEISSTETNIYKGFIKMLEEDDQGDYIGYSDIQVEETYEYIEEDDKDKVEEVYSVDITSIIHFENKDIKMTMHVFCFDPNTVGNIVSSADFGLADEDKTLGEKMGEAGINTAMGMGTVFIVLIFISLIISAFSFIPKITEKLTKKKSEELDNEDVKVEKITSTDVVESNIDDTELIAVIAAAIAASEQVSTDSFVVRSIRRR